MKLIERVQEISAPITKVESIKELQVVIKTMVTVTIILSKEDRSALNLTQKDRILLENTREHIFTTLNDIFYYSFL
jgi:hypothetical protein